MQINIIFNHNTLYKKSIFLAIQKKVSSPTFLRILIISGKKFENKAKTADVILFDFRTPCDPTTLTLCELWQVINPHRLGASPSTWVYSRFYWCSSQGGRSGRHKRFQIRRQENCIRWAVRVNNIILNAERNFLLIYIIIIGIRF